MKIILLNNMKGLGNSGDTIQVKSGYARNYLIPSGYALFANKENTQQLKHQKEKKLSNIDTKMRKSYLRILTIKQISPIKIFSQASSSGKLFGSVGLKDILNTIIKTGFKIKKNELIMEDGSIRTIGHYYIVFQPYKEVSCYLLIQVIPEKK